MLVGAVAIALVIVGIVVVYNTVLYSDTQTASGTTNDARQAEAFSQQVEKEIGTLAAKLNASNNFTGAQLNDSIGDAMGNWSQTQSVVHANTDPVFVTIDPVGCSGGNCTGSSPTFQARVIWEAQDFTYNNTINVTVPSP
jgi:hypothetical protein